MSYASAVTDQLRLTPGNLGDLITWLDKLDVQAFQWELKKLRALRIWAMQQAGIDYEEGGRARIVDGYTVSSLNSDGSANGWWDYRECLAGGATGTVVRIDFSPHHMAWYADFRPDREWVLFEMRGETVRNWHGPADDTPDGYAPPSAWEQEHYPDGRKHIFAMRAENLRPLP